MEPLLPDDSKELEDLATDLVAKASGLAATRLHPVLRASVGDLSALNELLLLQAALRGTTRCRSISTAP